ncbi:Pcc1-domain-containing protein [Tuber magnatum]|uniref:Pcc1-domain-containing protein n=1 Tax=Tuber magnatum TaxID=42249 RepID=A0A317SUM6_9PEZI|nr:Pcc1-domain-containing protein [Tuber magnatum]
MHAETSKQTAGMATAAIAASPPTDPEYPHSLTISLPLPSHHLADTIQRALSVDQEISPFVQRTYTSTPDSPILQIHYKATTARMLRVATNGMFGSLGTVLRVCEELDVDVLEKELGE